jgi:hypothetical protein
VNACPIARVRSNPSLHPTCYSGLRPLPQAGELKRWATAEYEAPMRDAVHIGITEHIERVPREVSALIEKAEHPPSAPRISLRPLRRSRSGGYGGGWVRLCGPRLGRAARPSAVGEPPSYRNQRRS